VKSFRLSLVFLLVGCSQAMAQEPKWLVDARAKEGQLIEAHTVTSADKRISFSVPVALSGELKESKDSYEALLTLGPTAVADCEILNVQVDAAALLRATATTTFSDRIEKAQGKIETRGVEHVDAGVAGTTPYLAVSWLYRVNDGKGARLGALRQYAATRSGHGIYCALNDLGYAKTLETVVRALIVSLKTKDDADSPYYSEISVGTLGDMRIGYSSIEMWRDKDGDTRYVETNALLFARDAASLHSVDEVHVDWIRPDGTLINSKRVMGSNGEIDMDLTLKPDGSGWQVEGKFKGKDVKEAIHEGVPSTWLSQVSMLRNLLAKDNPIGAEASESEWLATDPSRFSEMRTKVLAAVDAKTYTVRQTTLSHSAELVVDSATGTVTRATMPLGPTTITLDRIYVQGSL
jgi:hypothetical protein